MLAFRSKDICNACYRISLDSALNLAISKADTKPYYVLFDEKERYEKEKKMRKSEIKCLLDESTDFDRYGLTNTYPLLFYIKENKLKNFIKIIR